MRLFAQLTKVDEEKRLVYGRAAEEAVDRAGEIMDYESSKPHFAKWSEEVAADTDGKSLGNVRAMHGKVAAGKLTAIDFNDGDKAIDVVAKVVDDAEWKKVLEGVYTGFSIGGSYVGPKKVEKVDGRDVTRYTAAPTEVSLVDRPCIPGAKFFEVQKADGTLAKVDFAAPDGPAEATDTAVDVQGTPDQVDRFLSLMKAQGLTMDDVLTKLAPPAPAAPLQKIEGSALRKSLYSCQSFLAVIGSLADLKRSAEYEAMYEGDPGDAAIAQDIAAVIAAASAVLQRMVAHELAEYAEADSGMVELAAKAGDLAKLANDADPVVELVKVGMRNSAQDAGRIAKIHDLVVELGHTCAPAPAGPITDVAAKADDAGALAKVDTAELQKLADANAELTKALGDVTARLAKLEALPARPTVRLMALAKSADVVQDHDAPAAPEPVLGADGRPNDIATLIKAQYRTGGQPLVK